MGGDGGVCANDRRYMPQSGFGEVKKKEKDRQTVDRERWTRCQHSKRALAPPLMADRAGQLYSMEAAVIALKKKERIAPYIAGVKDLFRISPQENAEKEEILAKLKTGDDSGDSVEDLLSLYECPITQQTTNGINKFCAASACGHVFSKRAVQQMGAGACPVCNAPTVGVMEWLSDPTRDAAANVIVDLIMDPEDLSEMTGKLVEIKQQERKEKDARKAAAAGIGAQTAEYEPPKKKAKKDKKDKKDKTAAQTGPAIPKGADPEVFKSIFQAKVDNSKASFLCR